MDQVQAGRLPAQPWRLDGRRTPPQLANTSGSKGGTSKDDIDDEINEEGGQEEQAEYSGSLGPQQSDAG